MSKLEKLLALTPMDQRLLAETFVLVALVRLGLSMMTVERLRQRLGKWIALKAANSKAIEAEVERTLWAVRTVSRSVPGATCLTQALAAQAMLARIGIETQLRLGVMRNSDSGEFRAHAWVERGPGRIIIGENGSLSDYAAFAPIV